MELFRRHYRRRFSKRENAQSWWVYFYFHCLNSAIYCSLHASAPSTCLHMQYIIMDFLSFRDLSPLFWKPKEKIRACSLHSVGSLLCKFWDCSESVERGACGEYTPTGRHMCLHNEHVRKYFVSEIRFIPTSEDLCRTCLSSNLLVWNRFSKHCIKHCVAFAELKQALRLQPHSPRWRNVSQCGHFLPVGCSFEQIYWLCWVFSHISAPFSCRLCF